MTKEDRHSVEAIIKANRQLINATGHLDLKLAKKAILNGANVNMSVSVSIYDCPECSYNFLMMLCNTKLIKYLINCYYYSEEKHIELVKLLLENGVDLNRLNTNPLFTFFAAAESGYTKITELLIMYGAYEHNDINIAMQIACEKGHLEMVKMLLGQNADIHAQKDKSLKNATEYGHTEITRLLLQLNANIYTDNYTPFENAIKNGYTDILNMLYEHHKNKLVSCKLDKKMFLQLAVKNKKPEIVKLLLNKELYMYSELELEYLAAADLGYIGIIAILLDFEPRLIENRSALQYATIRGHTDVVQYITDCR